MIAISSFLDQVEGVSDARLYAKESSWGEDICDYLAEVCPELFSCLGIVAKTFGRDAYSSCLFVFYHIMQRSKRDEAVRVELIRAVQCFKSHAWCRTQSKALKASPGEFLDKADGVAAFVMKRFYVFIHKNPDPCFSNETRNGMLCALALLLNAK